MPAPRTLRTLSLIALAALVLSAGLTRLRTNDLFIHLVTGRLILDERAVPSTDRYSFTAPGARYVTHEWLAATWYAIGERAAGPIGAIVASKVVPGLAILAALVAAFRCSGVSPPIAVGIATAALAVARNRMTQDRPEVMAIALLVTLLWLLLRDRERRLSGRPDRWIFAAAPLVAVWANVHASFPLGIALVAAFALGDRLDAWLGARDERAQTIAGLGVTAALALAAGVTRIDPPSFAMPTAAAITGVALLFAADAFTPLFRVTAPAAAPGAAEGGPRPWLAPADRRWLAVLAATVAAIAVNPQGAGIYLFPFEFTAGVNTVTERIGEWRPLLEAPFLKDTSELACYASYLGLWAAALALGARRGVLDRREVGVLLLFGVLPLRHVRWMALFALVTAPALAALLSRVRAAAPAHGGRRPALTTAATAAFTAAAVALLASVAWRFATLPPDPLFATVLALVWASGAVALAAAWRPALPERALLATATAATASLAVVGVAWGVPGRQGIDYQRGFQWAELDRVGGNLVEVAPAVAFLEREGITGRLLTEYPWAGYAIHQLWPDVTVFLDSRSEVYGDALLALLLDMDRRPRSTRLAIDRYGTDLFLVESRGFPWDDRLVHNAGIHDVLQRDPAWSLLYFDDGAALYAKRDVDRGRPLPSALDGIDPRALAPATLSAPDPAAERTLREAVRRAPHASLPRFALASLLQAREADDEALELLEQAWLANPRQPAAASLAGRIAEDRGDRDAARLWYGRALSVAPTWRAIRARREALGS